MSTPLKKAQAEVFNIAAREIDVDESDDALDRIMGKLDLKKKPEPEKKTDELNSP